MPKGKPGSYEHGTNSGYVRGCRAECCKKAHRDDAAERRKGHTARVRELADLPKPTYAKGDTLDELLEAW